MAWALTARGFTKAVYVATDDVGDTFTPAENDIMIVISVMDSNVDHTTVTGWGATWTSLVSPTLTNTNLAIWAARIGAAPGSGVCNIDFGAASCNHSSGVIQIAGASTTAGIGIGGSNLFRQLELIENNNPASPMAITTLAAFSSSTNLALTIGGISSNFPFAPKSGFTELLESSGATYNPNVWAAYRTTEDTTHQLIEQTAGDFDYRNVVGVAIEMLEASGGGGGSNISLFGGKLAGLFRGKL